MKVFKKLTVGQSIIIFIISIFLVGVGIGYGISSFINKEMSRDKAIDTLLKTGNINMDKDYFVYIPFTEEEASILSEDECKALAVLAHQYMAVTVIFNNWQKNSEGSIMEKESQPGNETPLIVEEGK